MYELIIVDVVSGAMRGVQLASGLSLIYSSKGAVRLSL